MAIRLTESYLRKVIKEELRRVLEGVQGKNLLEVKSAELVKALRQSNENPDFLQALKGMKLAEIITVVPTDRTYKNFGVANATESDYSDYFRTGKTKTGGVVDTVNGKGFITAKTLSLIDSPIVKNYLNSNVRPR